MDTATQIEARQARESAKTRFWPGLSTRLLAMTSLFVLLAEALIFFPSIANYQKSWLAERVEMAQTAVLALEAAPERRVSDELSRKLLENAQIVAVAASSDMGLEMILSPAMEMEGQVDMQDLRHTGMIPPVAMTLNLIFSPDTAFVRVLETPKFEGEFIEVVVEAKPLRAELLAYANRILWLSLFISAFVGLLIYFSLVLLVVRPIRRITHSIERFRDDPRDWTSHIMPSGRVDEIGRAEETLADMEMAVKAALKERERLAQLGEAMAKINHDLRNSLASAQLVSDTLNRSEDPRVQRAAPRLERAIERAINLAEDTLKYGRSEPPAPRLRATALRMPIDEAALEALSAHDGIVFVNEVDVGIEAQADPDHLHRVIVNLVRNAAQAISAKGGKGEICVHAESGAGKIIVQISDNGPGIPPRVQNTLFQPFSASASKQGSGLGLAIARELALGMGGDLRLVRTDENGTVFELVLMQ